jgi:hypothetical protein
VQRLLALGLCLFAFRPAAAELPLPPAMVGLGTPAGERMFLEASARTAYWPLSAKFETQANQAFCGVATLVMVLNSLAVPAPEPTGYTPYHFFTQQDFFPGGGTTILQPEWIEHHGLTLDQLGQLAAHFGLAAQVVHATPDGLAAFRAQAAQALGAQGSYVIVNFRRATLSEEGYGHISPLAAYDATTDRFLLMDVARYKYPPAWVRTADLYAALDTIDPGNAGQTRGYLILRRGP